jgi:ribulose-5-phosphate 4-epimerase/fuculose-1-phosphate aldolase
MRSQAFRSRKLLRLAEKGKAMPDRTANLSETAAVAIDDLLAANRILSNEGVIDALGHVSCRHPANPAHFLMSRARAPALVTAEDLMEFAADGTPFDPQGRRPYVERFIHAAIYAARPDIGAVVHDHSAEIIPFGVSTVPLRPVSHVGGLIGAEVPVWDIAERFGDATNLMVVNLDMGHDLARKLDSGQAVLMRGHGAVAAGVSIRQAVIAAITLNQQAQLLRQAIALGGAVRTLSDDEIAATSAIFQPETPGDAVGRTWEWFCLRAGVAYHPRGA